MSQNSKSINFIMTEIINRIFEKKIEKLFFFYIFDLFQLINLCFYINNLFENQSVEFFFILIFSISFFFRLKWIKLKLLFKKFKLWCIKIKILKIIHEIGEKIHVLKNKIKKTIKFFVFENFTMIKKLFNVLKIIRRWIKNFAKFVKFFFKFTDDVIWKWKNSKFFFFEFFKLKIAIVIFLWNGFFWYHLFLHK